MAFNGHLSVDVPTVRTNGNDAPIGLAKIEINAVVLAANAQEGVMAGAIMNGASFQDLQHAFHELFAHRFLQFL